MNLRMLAAVLLLAAAPARSADVYRAGVARVAITPTEPLWAGGYGARDHAVSETQQELYAKALVLEDPRGHRLLIVTTDLLGFPRVVADPITDAITQRYGFTREQIMLSSSHTHSGPVLRESLEGVYPMTAEQWAAVRRYSHWMQGRVVDVVGAALQHMAPATLEYGLGQAGFAVNRRENSEKQVLEGHVPKGPVDHDVPVLRVRGADGGLRVVLFGYACHNTVMDFYKWCGDYAGYAQAELEAAHAGATAMFFMGCGGDQNPLPRRKIELAQKYGRELAAAVDRVLAGPMKPVAGPFAAAFSRVDLPLDRLPTREDLQKMAENGSRAEKVLGKRLLARLEAGQPIPASYPYPVQALQIGRDLTLLALAGEVVVDYSLRLKRELGPQATWVAGYCNDVFAYIPSRRVLGEGGYEGEKAMALYGLPGRWAPQVEELVVKAAREVAERVRGPAGKSVNAATKPAA